ncbi:MAG TPA: beta-N-acetylhexosaminidase [Caulobacteraceae bacterium]
MSQACILGCAGLTLSREEQTFFADSQPWGFILFKRNIDNPDQVRDLTGALRATVRRPDAPVLIDQEGGRVQRMGPPHWRAYPPAGGYGAIADPLTRGQITRLGARLMAHDLAAVGVSVDCLPVLDVPAPDADAIIGDRAYGRDPDRVAALGRAAAEGLIAGGVLPVIKHIPGHGRGRVDSHLSLPVVDATWAELEARDFAPFRALADMPMAMTAHVVFTVVDAQRPATTSAEVISRVIRGAIGFDGLLISDDLSMQALSGTPARRAADSLAAGCDVVLHCNGELAQMREVAAAAGPLAGRSAARAGAALARIPSSKEPFDAPAQWARFDAMFAKARAA